MNKIQDTPLELPEEYNISIFPEHIDLVIPAFENTYPYPIKTLAFKERDCGEWYNEFIDRIIAACGHEFLPVCRMSDGEFLFLLGEKPFDKRLAFFRRLRLNLSRLKHYFLLRGGIGAFTQRHYHSGQYSKDEWANARKEYPETICKMSKKGIIAWHLDYTNEPFAERYFPAFEVWMKEHKIVAHENNYYPFYFVYAMLTGPRRGELLRGRRVLVVNGAQGETKQKIIEGLKREGVSEVHWCPISLKRSLYDIVDMKPYIGKVDFAVVGAGIGKVNVMMQMEILNVPCIDAGFVFEIWKNSESKWERIFCACDDDLKNRGNRKTT